MQITDRQAYYKVTKKQNSSFNLERHLQVTL